MVGPGTMGGMTDTAPVWVLFRASTPTPNTGETARALYEKRISWITDDMRADARDHGCRFHRCWYARDGSAFWALTCWNTIDDAEAFYDRWQIDEEDGEEGWILEGDLGLVPLG